MTWKRLGVAAVGLLVVLALGTGAVYWASLQPPDFYSAALESRRPPEIRRKKAKAFEAQTLQLVQDIKNSETWSEEFEQDEINSWLAVELHGKFDREVPDGVSEPRVMLRDGRVLVGFRYEDESWQGVVSLSLRPWVADENELAIEVESVRAGLLPVPVDEVLEQVTRQLTANGWRVEWTQSEGNDVLVVHLDQPETDEAVLEAVEVTKGKIRIRGRRDAAGTPATTFQFPRMSRRSYNRGI